MSFNIQGSASYVGMQESTRSISRLEALISSGKTFGSDPASTASGARLASEIGKEISNKNIISNGMSAVTVGIGAVDSMLEAVNKAIAKAQEAEDAFMASGDVTAINNEIKSLGSVINDLRGTTYEGKTLFTGASYTVDGVTVGGSNTDLDAVDFSSFSLSGQVATVVTSLETWRDAIVTAGQSLGNSSNELEARLNNLDVSIQGLSEAKETRMSLDLPSLYSQLSDARFSQTQDAQFLAKSKGSATQVMQIVAQL